jgi:acyl-CoA synthetase (AMP-forming)/AMP-acid ligase II
MTSYSTIDVALRSIVEDLRDEIAMVDGDDRVSYSEFGDWVARVSGGLASLGIQKGDRLGIWLPNSLEWAVTFFSAARLGIVVVPINTALSVDEALYVLRQSRARMLILPDNYRSRDYLKDASEIRKMLSPSELHLVVVGATPKDATSFEALANGEHILASERAVAPDDPSVILYTSGTTGEPKGAVHSHRFLAPLMSAAVRLGIGRTDSTVLYLPMYHVYGLLAGLVMMILSGSKVVLMRQFDAAESLTLIEREGATIVFGVPTTYIDQLAQPDIDEYNLSAVRASFTPFPVDLCYRVSRWFGPCLNTYGMTETASIAFLSSLDDPLEVAISKVGYPVDGLEVLITDEATVRPLPIGEIGALLLRGPSITTHYFDKPEATSQAITADGWFRTGDLGSLDDQGRLSFHGRQSDQLRVGGEMVDPVEIEIALQSHPDVERASVAGVADERLGQVPYAWVQIRAGADCQTSALVQHVASRLAWFKRPRQIILVDTFPTTPSGKIQKYLLLARLHDFSSVQS